jgi:dihydrofolate reductase/thymidylate synthase
MYNIIFASTFSGGIGYHNNIPWNVPEDMKNFKKITSTTVDNYKRNAVIMGINTWISIPLEHKPLPKRLNIILSSKYENEVKFDKDIIFFNNIEKALEYCENNKNIENTFIIGGADIINQCLNKSTLHLKLDKIYLTLIRGYYECDKFIEIKNILKNYYINTNNIKFRNKYISLVANNIFTNEKKCIKK